MTAYTQLYWGGLAPLVRPRGRTGAASAAIVAAAFATTYDGIKLPYEHDYGEDQTDREPLYDGELDSCLEAELHDPFIKLIREIWDELDDAQGLHCHPYDISDIVPPLDRSGALCPLCMFIVLGFLDYLRKYRSEPSIFAMEFPANVARLQSQIDAKSPCTCNMNVLHCFTVTAANYRAHVEAGEGCWSPTAADQEPTEKEWGYVEEHE